MTHPLSTAHGLQRNVDGLLAIYRGAELPELHTPDLLPQSVRTPDGNVRLEGAKLWQVIAGDALHQV